MFKLFMLFILLSCLLIYTADSCGFPMGGGGTTCYCGGGGGGGCGGGCGRRKRSVIEQQLHTDEDAPCPQTAWKEIIDSSISSDIATSKHAIQTALFKAYETKFFITCAKNEHKHHLSFLTNGEGYCASGNAEIWCAVAVLLT